MNCLVCGSTSVKVQGSYRGNHPTFLELSRVECSSCGMVFAAPMPSEYALEKYNAAYFSNAHGGLAMGASPFFSGIARLRLAHVHKYLAKYNISVLRVLELGPGTGFFARNWLDLHAENEYWAVESDASCHASLRNIGVNIVEFSAMEKELPPVDLLVMSHVLEHVSDPVSFLKQSMLKLRDGGVIFIEVPCMDWMHKATDEPHLLFFDKKSMHHLLNMLGFDEIEVSYHGKTIKDLNSISVFKRTWMIVRAKLIALGLVAPFARIKEGMEVLGDPLERAVVAPFEAHQESIEPAWWLRAIAKKRES